MANRPIAGDIVALECPSGFAYVAYGGRGPSLGAAIWIVPKVFREPSDDWLHIFNSKGYFVFYAIHTALKNGHLRKVGYSPYAAHTLPGPRRNALKTDGEGARHSLDNHRRHKKYSQGRFGIDSS